MKGLILQKGSGSKTAIQIPLLSITTAPSGTFAVGSKYYNSTDTLIYTAVTANTWDGATTAAPVFNVIYTFGGNYYVWDGDNLEKTDVTRFEEKANKTNSFTSTSEVTYPSSKGLSDGLATKLSDAPSDGKQYGRKDAAWIEVGGGGAPTLAYFDVLAEATTVNTGVDLSAKTVKVYVNGLLQRPNVGETDYDYEITTTEGVSSVVFNTAFSAAAVVCVEYI